MDFTLSDEQDLLRTTARALLAKECPPELVRASVDDTANSVEQLWPRLREWVALGDGPLIDHCLFLEETGRALAPGPYLTTSALFLPLLRGVGHPVADAVAAGEASGTVAAVSDDELLPFALDADCVDHVALVLPGPGVVVVDATEAHAEPVEWLDLTRRAFRVQVGQRAGDGASPIAPAALEAVVQRATVALSAELCGVGRWLLEATVEYAKQREQFGRPIGSYQAIQHKLADMALELERATAAVYYAAMVVDAEAPDRYRAVHVAKAAAGTAAVRCARDGIQVHGGIGYTWEHDLHLYLRRAYTGEHLLGTTAWHHDRLAELLLDPTG